MSSWRSQRTAIRGIGAAGEGLLEYIAQLDQALMFGVLGLAMIGSAP
jgi:hypothetical protein